MARISSPGARQRSQQPGSTTTTSRSSSTAGVRRIPLGKLYAKQRLRSADEVERGIQQFLREQQQQHQQQQQQQRRQQQRQQKQEDGDERRSQTPRRIKLTIRRTSPSSR